MTLSIDFEKITQEIMCKVTWFWSSDWSYRKTRQASAWKGAEDLVGWTNKEPLYKENLKFLQDVLSSVVQPSRLHR